MNELEKLAKQIMAECEKDNEPIEWADALIMARMELGAKEIKNYTQSTPEKVVKTNNKPKVVKVSAEKTELFNEIWTNLYDVYRENAQIVKENKEISVQIGEKSFKIDIVEHRKAK